MRIAEVIETAIVVRDELDKLTYDECCELSRRWARLGDSVVECSKAVDLMEDES